MNKPLSQPNMIKEACASRKGHSPAIEVLIFTLVVFIAQAIMSLPIGVASVVWALSSDAVAEISAAFSATGDFSAFITDTVALFTEELPDWLMTIQLFSTAIMIVTAIVYCRVFEGRRVQSMGLRKKHAVREYLVGAAIGIALISLTVGGCVACGSLTLTPSEFSIGIWLLYFVGFFVQGMSEEVLCRGYLMVSLARKNSPAVAVFCSSFAFALLHIANPSFGVLPLVNITLFGVMLSLYVWRRGNLWGACAIHSLWNFFQGNVFGVSVSGTGSGASPLSATLDEGMKLLNGGGFGIEGGLIITLVLAIATVLTFFFLPKKPDEHTEPVSVEA